MRRCFLPVGGYCFGRAADCLLRAPGENQRESAGILLWPVSGGAVPGDRGPENQLSAGQRHGYHHPPGNRRHEPALPGVRSDQSALYVQQCGGGEGRGLSCQMPGAVQRGGAVRRGISVCPLLDGIPGDSAVAAGVFRLLPDQTIRRRAGLCLVRSGTLRPGQTGGREDCLCLCGEYHSGASPGDCRQSAISALLPDCISCHAGGSDSGGPAPVGQRVLSGNRNPDHVL